MKSKILALLTVLVAGSSFADDVKLMGTISQSVSVPYVAQTNRFYSQAAPAKHPLTLNLMAIKLSSNGQQALQSRLHQSSIDSPMTELMESRGAKQLGMNNVPVLNQGGHGTCVTFAVSAAIDAALNINDEISQVCQLTLGNYLEKQGYASSGWDGTFAHAVINQMETFGVISKRVQHEQGCGGLYEYPKDTFDTPAENLSIESFHQISESLNKSEPLAYPLLHVAQSFSRPINTANVLANVKAALNRGDRVVFGSLLAHVDLGLAGAVGSYKATNDTWVITPTIREEMEKTSDFAGHEMIITGYNDNAIAKDENGQTYQGLLTLRNSWGDQVGNQGDFYMSYDYFMVMVIEAHQVLSKS